jgi:peptidoglycan/xylan/chitin deacetylase (PgdA/CDA1 family)
MAIRQTLVTFLILVLISGALAARRQAQQSAAVPPLGIDWTPEQIQRAVGAVRAGRKLTPKSWPNGARVAVNIGFDVDNELLARNNPLPATLSQGEYGAVEALPRLLRILDKHQIPASFYIPAVSAMLHPEMVPAIMKSGRHEIGVHGWIHENLPALNDAALEERLLTQSIEYLTKVTGKRPVGFRAPSWAFSPHTLGLIRKAGFLYDSSLMAMDEPYEIVAEGRPTGLIELPIEWILDDFPYFSGNASGSLPAPDLVFQIYKEEFDVAYDERTLVVLTTHPHVVGHRSRAAQLDRLIAYMKSKPGVWFATAEQIARAVQQPSRTGSQ